MLFYVVGMSWWTRIRPSRHPLDFHADGMPLLVRRG